MQTGIGCDLTSFNFGVTMYCTILGCTWNDSARLYYYILGIKLHRLTLYTVESSNIEQDNNARNIASRGADLFHPFIVHNYVFRTFYVFAT